MEQKAKYFGETMLISLAWIGTRWAGKENDTVNKRLVKTKSCIQSISGQFACFAKANIIHSKLVRKRPQYISEK